MRFHGNITCLSFVFYIEQNPYYLDPTHLKPISQVGSTFGSVPPPVIAPSVALPSDIKSKNGFSGSTVINQCLLQFTLYLTFFHLLQSNRGKWASMHVRIAWDIFEKQKAQAAQHTPLAAQETNTNGNQKHPANKSASSKNNRSTIKSSSDKAHSHQISSLTKESSGSKIQNATEQAPVNHAMRSASAISFSANYPRFGPPFGGPPSMSAPPMLPPFPSFPPRPPLSSCFITDAWQCNSFPGNPMAPPTRPQYAMHDLYANVNSASSALSAWANNLTKPTLETVMLPSQSASTLPDKNIVATNNSGTKRKHEESEGKNNSSSSRQNSHHNGDAHSNTHKKHASSKNSVLANGSRSSNETKSESSKSKRETPKQQSVEPSSSFNGILLPPKPPTSAPTSASLLGSSFPNYDLFAGMPPPPNLYLDSRNGSDLSRPSWPYHMALSSTSSSPSMIPPNSMIPDPFKSLQDISQRPGMVNQNKESLFARYSMLSSSGGGASIFDKLTKEQMEKYESMQSANGHQFNSAIPPSAIRNISYSDLAAASSSRPSSTHSRLPSTSMAPPTSNGSLLPFTSPYSLPVMTGPGNPYLSSFDSQAAQTSLGLGFMNSSIVDSMPRTGFALAMSRVNEMNSSVPPPPPYFFPPPSPFSSGSAATIAGMNYMKPPAGHVPPLKYNSR